MVFPRRRFKCGDEPRTGEAFSVFPLPLLPLRTKPVERPGYERGRQFAQASSRPERREDALRCLLSFLYGCM